ncbi:LysR family transcriptional regulator [Bradyrhizobium manausense]|uniref:LysR family transcriptional regulator n=1 Tax=Bradyrhizobium manausense TaxID=989370 RepID=UPI001BAE0108|nr:LysR family transcriptional regulator [Bradyrhizobium manausense]MBR0687817.1 LysR family transcriptional regulator [Bradyrhizobium manausense]
MLEFGQLRSFIAVATELNFGRAAKRLHMTQPPLSRQIQLLERELDVQLFTRTSRSVELTSAGRAFLVEARALLQQSETAVQVARRAAQTAEGALKIGFVGATTYGFLPRLAARMRSELPNIEVSFHELTSVEQLDALASSRIDLGLVRPLPAEENVQAACVMREGLALALPLDHPLAVRRRPQLAQLHGESFIMYSTTGRYMHDLLNASFRVAGVQPSFVQFMSQAHAILSLVSTGLGIAIVPEETRNACFDNVVFRPIKLGPAVAAELHAIWRPDNRNSALVAIRELMLRMNNS